MQYMLKPLILIFLVNKLQFSSFCHNIFKNRGTVRYLSYAIYVKTIKTDISCEPQNLYYC